MDVLTVLLVEDDPLLATMFETVLTDAGLKVLAAQDAVQAIDIINERHTELVALLTDIRLGNGPKGWTVATRARELVPSMPVVYMSGDSAADWHAHGVPDSIIIQKPFVDAQLVTAVTMLMNASPASMPTSDGQA